MPLLVGGEWRTAGVLETNQLDSILQALAAFLTTVFTPKIQAGSIQILPLRILIIISRELPAFLPTEKFVITSKAVHLLFVLLKLRPPELFLFLKSLPFASFTILSTYSSVIYYLCLMWNMLLNIWAPIYDPSGPKNDKILHLISLRHHD